MDKSALNDFDGFHARSDKARDDARQGANDHDEQQRQGDTRRAEQSGDLQRGVKLVAHDRREHHGQDHGHHPCCKAEQCALGHEFGKDAAPGSAKELSGSHFAGAATGESYSEVDVIGHGKEQDEQRGDYQDVDERGIAAPRHVISVVYIREIKMRERCGKERKLHIGQDVFGPKCQETL